jgi:hypothetical protein
MNDPYQLHGPFHLYDAATGLFSGQSFHSNDEEPGRAAAFAKANTPAGHAVYEGTVADHQSQRVHLETGELVDHQPPQPSADHAWCGDSKRWHLSPAAQARIGSRAASAARIAYLEHSQHRFLRQHALGDPSAIERLKAIDAEITALSAELG